MFLFLVGLHLDPIWAESCCLGLIGAGKASSEGICFAATGIVKSTKMHRTIIVRRNYAHYIRKYGR